MSQLTLEERFQVLALEDKLKALPAVEPPREPGEALLIRAFNRFSAGFNEGLANVLGFPADLFQKMLEATGLPTDKDPLLGSGMLKRAMRAIALPTKEDVGPPRGLAGRVLEEVGEQLGGSVVPLGAVGSTLSLARKGVVALPREGIGELLLRPFSEQPLRTLGFETAAATAAGVGAAGAEEVFGESPLATLGGMAAGTLTVGGALTGAQRVGQFKSLTLPTPARVEAAVGGFFRRLSGLPSEQAARQLATVGQAEVQPLTSQALRSPGILALERGQAARSPEFANVLEQTLEQQQQQVFRALEGVIPSTGIPPHVLGEAIATRIQGIRTASQTVIQQAQRRLAEEVATFGTLSPDEANRIIRSSILEAERTATEQSSQLFRVLDQQGQITGSSARLKEAVTAIRKQVQKVERPENLPFGTMKTIAKLQPEESVSAYMALRSRVTDEIREESVKAAPNHRLISRLETLKESVDDTITNDLTASPSIAPAYEQARQFFRDEVAGKFRRGTVAKVLRTGPLSIPESATIAQFFRSGRGAKEGAQDFLKVLGDSTEAREAIRAAAVDDFVHVAAPLGAFKPLRAQQWIERHRAALQEFPDIQQAVTRINAEGTQSEAIRVAATQTVKDAERSSIRFFLDSEPHEAVRAILRSPRGDRALQEVVQGVRHDPLALNGLRQAVWQEVVTGSVKPDALARIALNPSKLRSSFDAAKGAFRVSGLYTSEELTRMEQVVQVAELTQRLTRPSPVVGELELMTIQNQLQEWTGTTLPGLWSRFYAVSRSVVSPRFIASELASRMGQRILASAAKSQINALVERALIDPEVAQTLLMKVTPQTTSQVTARLRGHLANLGPLSLTELGNEGP